MAKHLGLNKYWFHAGDKPHYDIPVCRIADITAQCEVVTSKELLAIITYANVGLPRPRKQKRRKLTRT